jgi:hypothetical protein
MLGYILSRAMPCSNLFCPSGAYKMLCKRCV